MDWTWFFYIGTQILKFNEEEFWKLTFKKLFGLYDIYLEMNGHKKKQEKQFGYIDEILF